MPTTGCCFLLNTEVEGWIIVFPDIRFHVYRQGHIIADFVIMVRSIFIDVELTASIIADYISDDFGCRVVF